MHALALSALALLHQGSRSHTTRAANSLDSELAPCLGSQLAPFTRRDVARLALLAAVPALAGERADAGTNPANSYYFPQAKYRYLPRINRASNVLETAPALLSTTDWDALQAKVWFFSDDAATALTLYANSVEGSRSSKGKKKSARQKMLYVHADAYTKAIERLGRAIKQRNTLDVEKAVADGREALTQYQELAEITGANGAARAARRDARAFPARPSTLPHVSRLSAPPARSHAPPVALPPDVPVDQQKYLAVFKGGGYKNEGKVIIPLR
jgi:hypothetical protein